MKASQLGVCRRASEVAQTLADAKTPRLGPCSVPSHEAPLRVSTTPKEARGGTSGGAGAALASSHTHVVGALHGASNQRSEPSKPMPAHCSSPL